MSKDPSRAFASVAQWPEHPALNRVVVSSSLTGGTERSKGSSSIGRASVSKAESCRFKSCLPCQRPHGSKVEQRFRKAQVVGSIPTEGSKDHAADSPRWSACLPCKIRRVRFPSAARMLRGRLTVGRKILDLAMRVRFLPPEPRRHRLAVRTAASHAANPGSIPGDVTSIEV